MLLFIFVSRETKIGFDKQEKYIDILIRNDKMVLYRFGGSYDENSIHI